MTVLRNANVIDGTGAAARAADVVVDDGNIAAVAPAGSVTGHDVVDLDGLVLAPGFIDAHTHYDAQVLWDPDLTPSSWHGVTTVIMGNCGFGLAPTRPDDREALARTLENVEGMSLDALLAGITWTFESFPEYLDALERARPRLNVAAMIGHTPLRLYVLGETATERPASDSEVARMRDLVREAIDAGAVGFATSKAPSHIGAWGKPVPSRIADFAEIAALVEPLGERGQGTIQVTIGPDVFVDELAALSKGTGRPVTWTGLLAGRADPDIHEVLAWTAAAGGEVHPQVACRPIVVQVSLRNPSFGFNGVAAMREVFQVAEPERAAVYRDPQWRERARAEMPVDAPRWRKITVEETVAHPELVGGPSLAELAADRGVHPLDLLCDLALEDDLRTRFRVVQTNDDDADLRALLAEPSTLITISDAGAHASQICDAVFATHLLGHWVREEGVLTLEHAVWRLTGHPASVYRLPRRGRIAPGFAADLVAFDPDTVGPGPQERVWDLPAGADRLLAPSLGIEAMWVNGTQVRAEGRDRPGVRPGQVLRGTA